MRSGYAPYNVFDEFRARDILHECIGKVRKDRDVKQIQKELESACDVESLVSNSTFERAGAVSPAALSQS